MPATSKSPYEYTQMMKSDNDAPEVALQNYPIPALEDSDGLQSNPNGYAPYVADRAAAYNAAHDPVDAPKDVTQKQRSRRPSWLWLLLGAVIAAAIGLGAGVGIGYGVGTTKTNAKWERNGYGDGSACPTRTVTVLSNGTSTATATASAVTSGTTGIAAFNCNSTGDNTYTSSNPRVVFAEECFTDYTGGRDTWNSSTVLVKDLAAKTVYSFESCMDQCALYTGNQGDAQLCQAVTYSANLTGNVQANAGNCWLKSARGIRNNWNPQDNYDLVASAYIVNDL